MEADCLTVSFLPLASVGVELSLEGSDLSLDFSAGTLFLSADASELIGGDGAPSWSVVGYLFFFRGCDRDCSWGLDGLGRGF